MVGTARCCFPLEYKIQLRSHPSMRAIQEDVVQSIPALIFLAAFHFVMSGT